MQAMYVIIAHTLDLYEHRCGLDEQRDDAAGLSLLHPSTMYYVEQQLITAD